MIRSYRGGGRRFQEWRIAYRVPAPTRTDLRVDQASWALLAPVIPNPNQLPNSALPTDPMEPFPRMVQG